MFRSSILNQSIKTGKKTLHFSLCICYKLGIPDSFSVTPEGFILFALENWEIIGKNAMKCGIKHIRLYDIFIARLLEYFGTQKTTDMECD